MGRSLYDVLELSEAATRETIDAAYAALRAKYEAQLNGGDAEAASRLNIARAAHEILSDPVKRAVHDRRLRDQRGRASSGARAAAINSPSTTGEPYIGAVPATRWPYGATPDQHEEEAPPRRFSTPLIVLVAVGLLVVVAGAASYYSPHWTLRQMKDAAMSRDPDKLSSYIDYPAVRTSLKAELSAQLAVSDAQEARAKPFAAFGAMLASALLDRMIDTFVTPEMIARMMAAEKPRLEAPKPRQAATGTADESKVSLDVRYVTWGRVVASISADKDDAKPVKFDFDRQGLFSWKLVAIRLPL